MLSYIWACLTCSDAPSLRINGQNYSIVRLLGEGGFAYVYLVRQEGTGKLFAMKKIRCILGGESVASAMREVEACHVFRSSKRVISCLDSYVRQEQDGTKTVFIVLPYFASGNLQDVITEHVVSNTSFSEAEVWSLARSTTLAIGDMHHFRRTSGNDAIPQGSSGPSVSISDRAEEERLLNGEHEDAELAELAPYAHRDIKPANIMFAAEDRRDVVLMDLGSCSPARVDVATRQKAVELQDLAAEHCTLPYRAPELFDVRTGARIDEKVDIWGFGCTLYALMYSVSPFEREEQVAGANINIAIAGGRFTFPESPQYSEALRALVRKCLNVNASERPSVDEIIELIDNK